MEEFHEMLARLALRAAGRYGFALAGGYAVQEAGLVSRSSDDVDLFTAWNRRHEFDLGLTAIMDAYRDAGLDPRVINRYETFARIHVSHGGSSTKVELSADWRANEPVMMSVGPVLHPDDAVANKIGALYGRAQARDFIDVDGAVQSGRYSHHALLTLAEASDGGFDRALFAQALARLAGIGDDDFEVYGLSSDQVRALRARFNAWREEILTQAG